MQEERFITEETSQSSDVNQMHIQHIVSKMDTLAGLAIKYGVEASDIKRLNSLVTDHQMFALRSVQIPLPGRHPPSLSSTTTSSSASNRLYGDAFDPFSSPKLKSPRQRVTPAMISLQGFFGHTPPKPMVKESENSMPRDSLIPDRQLSRHHRTQSLAIENFPGNSELADDVAVAMAGASKAKKSGSMKSVRRRQKTETDSMLWSASELENADSYSARTGKLGAAVRDVGRMSAAPLGDSVRINVLGSVRKSSSTSNLQESDSSSTMWPASMWSLKPDSLPRPMDNAWRNKAAID